MNIGVLAVQGSFKEHGQVLENLVESVNLVRKPSELKTLDGLVIPGGESTTIGDFLGKKGLASVIKPELPIFGTCAGMIVLAKKITGERKKGQSLLKMMDIKMERNAYGRQTESFEADIKLSWDDKPFHGVFIRAPKITNHSPDVTVLARYKDSPVFVRQGNNLACSFHPELTEDDRIHRYFIEEVVKNKEV